jgi:predicted ATPase
MLTGLKLGRFKNFSEANLILGPLTLLIGSNASGKSNIRDAFRFLHGISRGYNLAEIMGEKYIEGGVLQWRGIRGGTREVTYLQAATFELIVDIEVRESPDHALIFPDKVRYFIEVEPGSNGSGPRVIRESLRYHNPGPRASSHTSDSMIFDSHPAQNPPEQRDAQHIVVKIPPGGKYQKGHVETFIAYQPVLTQIADRITDQRKDKTARQVIHFVKETIAAFNSMRFLDLTSEAMRRPSLPGQIILGDRGENLSSVLQAICEDTKQKQALIEWIRELTPMDAREFEFIPDQTGRILVTLVEENGRRTSAYSASDGTLRFLAMIAALLGPESARFYFFEELDNGLHPARLYLLLQLVERKVSEGIIQMIATTHSPQLFRFLSPKAREHASLVYRLPGVTEGRIKRILDIPDIQQIIEQQDLARLHESGWFEDAMVFLDEAGETK